MKNSNDTIRDGTRDTRYSYIYICTAVQGVFLVVFVRTAAVLRCPGQCRFFYAIKQPGSVAL